MEVFDLEAEIDVDWSCHSMDCHWAVLLPGETPPAGLPPGPAPQLGALPLGLFGSALPDPVLWELDPDGGSPGRVLAFALKGVHLSEWTS